MPNTYVIKRVLTSMIGKEYTDEEFEDICFGFGVEVEFTDTNEMKKRHDVDDEEATKQAEEEEKKGDKKAQEKDKKAKKGKKKEKEEKAEPVYKIEVPANRYDLLSAEGIALAMRSYLGLGDLPQYRILNKNETLERVIVLPETKEIRPYCVAAIVRNVTFTEDSYNSFINFSQTY